MALATFSDQYKVVAEPLTPEGFAAYGGVISADHQLRKASGSSANYGTAVKVHKVAPITNNYQYSRSGVPATANWNIFRCSAPTHLIRSSGTSSGTNKVYTAKVVERHPYLTQTFVPMGQDLAKVSYLVIVAKTDTTTEQRLPDPKTVKAFICKGNQAVTYGVGTWHAPMVVVDQLVKHIDFAVLIHENGVVEEDCQECYFEPGIEVGYELVGKGKL